MKKINLCAASLAAALLLGACANGGNVSEQGVVLTIVGKVSDLQKSYMTSVFEQYENATGNKLDIVAIEDGEFESKESKQVENGKVPDILLHFNNADLMSFDVADNFCYLNDEAWVDDLTDGADAYCRDADGNLLGLPFWESSVSGCYYNKTLLDSLGLKPAATQTEFNVLCEALSATGYTPICWPGSDSSWMIQFGLDPIFADDPELLEKLNRNEIKYSDIPAVTDMLQWISDAADKGWFGTSYLDDGWNSISPAMSSGDAVMTFIWDTWFYTDLARDNKYSIDDFALMPVFLNTADEGTYEGGNLNMMMVNKNSPHKQEALDFLSFCAEKEHYNKAFEGISTVSCFKSQTTNIQSDMVTEAKESISQHERVSTAASKIIGYRGEDVVAAMDNLLRKKTDVAGCVKILDDSRIAAAKLCGAEGF